MTYPLVAMAGEPGRTSGTVSAEVAAALLGTTPGTVRVWTERFGYPEPAHAADAGVEAEAGVRYSYSAVIALREALNREVSVASAVLAAIRDSSRGH